MSPFTAQGICTALVTPFGEDGAVNWKLVPTLIEHQLAQGVSTVAVTAGAGEYLALSANERTEMVQTVSSISRGRGAVIAGVLAPDTGSAIAAGQAARRAGADALLVLTPYYVSPSGEGIVNHFRDVATAVDLPLIIYNNPGRTGLNLDLPLLERLAELPQVVAIKECDRDLGRVASKMARLGWRLAFLCGEDDLCLPSLVLGARGAIMAATNLVAPWAVALFDAVRQQRLADAQSLYTKLLRFIALYKGPNHPYPLKQAMALAGIPVGTARPPLHPLDNGGLTKLAKGLAELGLLQSAETGEPVRSASIG